MTTKVATDLDSFALIISVGPLDTDDAVRDLVDASALQQPVAVVVDLNAGGRRSATLLNDLSRLCAQHAVPMLVAPLLAATLVVAGSAMPPPQVRSFPTVEGALGSLPHAAIPPSDQRNLTLEAVLTAPAQARAVAAEAARSWGLDRLLFPAQLVTSELVSNAVVHTETAVDLLLRRHGRSLQIGVRDLSPRRPRPPTHAPSDLRAIGGRGMFLVSSAASRWGCLVGSSDKVVWAQIDR